MSHGKEVNSNVTSIFISRYHFETPINNQSISTDQFLKASQGAVEFVSLCGRVFSPVRCDISGNIEKLTTIYSSEPASYLTLDSIVKSGPVGADALLWLTRALDYIYHFLFLFLQDFEEGTKSKNLSSFFESAYESTLKKHHNWFIQKIFQVCLLAVLDRDNFLLLLSNRPLLTTNELITQTEEAIFADIKTYISGLKQNLEVIQQIFKQADIEY